MNEGRIVQIGSPRAIYDRPYTRFVAEFIGSSNFIEGTVLGPEGSETYLRVRTPMGDIVAQSDMPLRPGAAATIAIRPENVELSEEPGNGSPVNRYSGAVDQKVFLGDFVDLQVKAGDLVLLSRAHPSLRTPVGGTLHIHMPPEHCVVLHEGGAAKPSQDSEQE
jgi:iron(III) transport system ATP-binding protein